MSIMLQLFYVVIIAYKIEIVNNPLLQTRGYLAINNDFELIKLPFNSVHSTGALVHNVGHSLGGAIAPLALLKIKDKLNLPWDKFELYTYEQSRTGNVQFAKWFDFQPITVPRSANYYVLVLRTPPPSVLFYGHHANELFSNGTSVNYCDSSVLEDSKCALSVPDSKLYPSVHTTYYNVLIETSNVC
ncbi:hypothetical protein K502DRAFT_327159 [Neoconidiobolus thromboides FSU 785]|nr:hypothetical protein K502DRAFT_327159 [Neoconidiobolus thromboides FSU 785]